jgi:crossover junction endodeoxyribonuclease RuvC
MICIGIDIGLTGAVAFIDPAGGCVVEDIPVLVENEKNRIDGHALATVIRRHWPAGEPALVAFEDVRPRPQVNGGVRGNTMHSQGSLMRSRGAVESVLDCLRLRAEVVQPQTWKRFYGLIGSKDKADAVAVALRLYPQAAPRLARKKDHNRGDALLIAHFAKRQLVQLA